MNVKNKVWPQRRFAALLCRGELFFQTQQCLLHIEAARISHKLPVRADHPMTGDGDADGIFVVSHAHGAAGLRIADGNGDFFVGSGFAVRDVAERVPDFF